MRETISRSRTTLRHLTETSKKLVTSESTHTKSDLNKTLAVFNPLHLMADTREFIHIPVGASHSYKAVSPRGARHLTQLVPDGPEPFFRAIGHEDYAAHDRNQDIRKLELAPQYGLEVFA
jgi:hypothetical protein